MSVKKEKRPSGRKNTKPLVLFVPALAAVACGFMALLSLRLANAPVWDDYVFSFMILFAAVIGVVGLFGLVVPNSVPPAVRSLVASTAFLVGVGILMQHRVKGIQWNALTVSDF